MTKLKLKMEECAEFRDELRRALVEGKSYQLTGKVQPEC